MNFHAKRANWHEYSCTLFDTNTLSSLQLQASSILTTLATATLLAPATAPADLDASPAAPASDLHTVLPAPPATALCVAVGCSDVPTLTESLYNAARQKIRRLTDADVRH